MQVFNSFQEMENGTGQSNFCVFNQPPGQVDFFAIESGNMVSDPNRNKVPPVPLQKTSDKHITQGGQSLEEQVGTFFPSQL